MAEFTALRHTWDFPESVNVIDFRSFTSERALDPLNGNANGICHDGTFFYVTDPTDNKVYKYNAAFVLQANFNLDALNADATGICHDGTFFYVVDNNDNKVYKYNAAFVLQANFNLDAANIDSQGIWWHASYFYVIDLNNNKVYIYDSAFALKNSFALDDFNADAFGIVYDGTFFYVTNINGTVYKYNSAFILQTSFTITGSFNLLGICHDGAFLYIVDDSTDKVYIYPYSTKTIGGHNFSIVLHDSMYESFAAAHMTGNVEYWLRAKDAADEVAIILKDATGNACIKIEIDADKIIGDGTDALDPALDHIWYYIRIDFDCTPNTYDLYINEVLELNNQAFGVNDDGSGLTKLVIAVDTDEGGYISAIGYDWDGDYDVGDNLSDTEDITTDITFCKIVEELNVLSTAELKIKGTAIADFEAGHEIDFYDSDSVLSWVGIILYPETVAIAANETIGKLKLLGLNSKFDNIYRKNFTTARDSDYIIKYIIDNFLTRYHSYDDEIDNFTITYKYDLKTKIQKMFKYLAMLERGVIHYKPDSEIFFNKYDNLTASGESWSDATPYVKIIKYTPAANRRITRTPIIGGYNSLGQVYVVGTGDEDEEDQFGINHLQTWRDSEITNFTEADQIATNLQDIYSEDTQLIKILTIGKKHLQIGYTIEILWAGVYVIALKDFLLTKRTWFPMIDKSILELTDNILSRKDFNVKVINKLYDEDIQQAHDDPNVVESTVDGTVQVLKSVAELRTGIITSQDADIFHLLGRAWVGYDGGNIDYAGFGHRDQRNATSYALLQHSSGNTYLNAPNGGTIYHLINDVIIMNMRTAGLQIGAGARITEFDTALLAASDTKVPTNTTVKEYSDLKAMSASSSYSGNSSGAQRTITSSLDFTPKFMYIYGQTYYSFTKTTTMAGKYAVRDSGAESYLNNSIEIISGGFKVGGDASNYCNLTGRTYHWVAIG